MLSQSSDGKILFIGEAKWTQKPFLQKSIHETLNALKAKGRPPLNLSPHSRLVYVLFVPEKPAKLQLPQDSVVIEAKDILL